MPQNCQLSLVVHVPQKASYYFQGMSRTAQRTHRFAGALEGNRQVTDTTGVEGLAFAPCGEPRNLNVNTELRAEVGTSDPARAGYMSVDSTDGAIGSVYHFSWKRCSGR
ncbi:DUF4360 domain-containing protein [Streptomyces goshikiensis]|uniref:DUF4360 domain-containing protein n=1 Tax=Streptomyces goshikiensis TaxID=1942 RepID=UPI0037990CB0